MKKESINEKVIGNYKVRTFYDESPESPRFWENLGTMICFHRNYNLGDKHSYDSQDYGSWDEMKKDIIDNENVHTILPLYLFDHSGISISTSPFGCQWDSGQVGFIFVSKHRIKQEGIEDKIVQECLVNEVKTYDQYLQGNVYGFEVVKVTKCDLGHEHEEVVESCYGYYDEDECMTEGIDMISSQLEEV